MTSQTENDANGQRPAAAGEAPQGFVLVHIDEYDKLGCCRRLLEIIAVGDSADPVKDAGDELVAHGFWEAAPSASAQPAARHDDQSVAAQEAPLPPLPEATDMHREGYTAEQMRAYASAALKGNP
jgi:hypothetical protein